MNEMNSDPYSRENTSPQIFADVRSPGNTPVVNNDLTLALVVIVALAFDFTNGFHDTGNAMATSIATGALPPVSRSCCRGRSTWWAPSCRSAWRPPSPAGWSAPGPST